MGGGHLKPYNLLSHINFLGHQFKSFKDAFHFTIYHSYARRMPINASFSSKAQRILRSQ